MTSPILPGCFRSPPGSLALRIGVSRYICCLRGHRRRRICLRFCGGQRHTPGSRPCHIRIHHDSANATACSGLAAPEPLPPSSPSHSPRARATVHRTHVAPNPFLVLVLIPHRVAALHTRRPCHPTSLSTTIASATSTTVAATASDDVASALTGMAAVSVAVSTAPSSAPQRPPPLARGRQRRRRPPPPPRRPRHRPS